MREIKSFIEQNSNEPEILCNYIHTQYFTFNPSTSSSLHRYESIRRIIWLCKKSLTDEQWYNLLTSQHLISIFSEICHEIYEISFNFMTVQEMSDILWIFSELSLRPSSLVSMIVNKLDRIFNIHKEQHFGYKTNGNKIKEEADMNVIGYVSGHLQLPFASNEFSDILKSFGELRIECGNLIQLLDAIIREHYEFNNRLLDNFLPKDLSQICIGYAMMDPAFHWYKIVWGLNRHLNILNDYIAWTPSELLDILHYDVCQRYINRGWSLQLSSKMQKLMDENHMLNIPRLVPPFFDHMLQSVHESLNEQMLTDQWYSKNVEGYQVPFSRWPSREQPSLLEIQSPVHFLRELNGKEFKNNDECNLLLNGRSLLRQKCLQSIFKNNMTVIKCHEWPQTNHLRQMFIRKTLKELNIPLNYKLKLLQHGLETHYEPIQKDLYD